MTDPTTRKAILQPPDPNILDNKEAFYRFISELWERSGGFKSAVTNLDGLSASVKELNTLTGIHTDDTVQEQLDSKVPILKMGSMAYQNADNVSITGGEILNALLGNVIIGLSQINSPTIEGGTMNKTIVTFPTGSTVTARLNGAVHVNTAAVGNIGAGEDSLMEYIVLAGTIYINFSYLEIIAFGIFAANGNNKRIKLKIDANILLDTTAVAANSGTWEIRSKIIRTTPTTLKCISDIISDNALIVDSATYISTITDTAVNFQIFCTGEATNDNDIVQEGLIINYYK